MSPNGQTPASFEDRLAALEKKVAELEQNLGANNKNITDGLGALIEDLEEMRSAHCELPPGCVL